MKKVIFTDLDGTLLDPVTYSYQPALPVVRELKKKGVPIIFCTAKTRAENEYYQSKLKIKDPFIAENGGAIYIPKNYFSFSFPFQRSDSRYFIIELGVDYKKLRSTLQKIREKTGFKIIGFGDMTIKQVAEDSGLPIRLAKLAKMKEYNESFKFLEGPEKKSILCKMADEAGLKIIFGGRYFNIIGKNNGKGRAVKILTGLFKKEFGRVQTIGIGDNLNDVSMLKAVDIPILLGKNNRWTHKGKNLPLRRIKERGPDGWVKAMRKLILKNFNEKN